MASQTFYLPISLLANAPEAFSEMSEVGVLFPDRFDHACVNPGIGDIAHDFGLLDIKVGARQLIEQR